MPENNQHRNNHPRQPMQGQGGQYRQGQHNMQGRPDRQGARRPSPNRQGARRTRKQQENDAQISAAVKGIIAIMLTLLIVVVVIMLFWKSLFTGTEKGDLATGTITSTQYHGPETKTATEREGSKKSTKKKTSKKQDDDEISCADEVEKRRGQHRDASEDHQDPHNHDHGKRCHCSSS